LSRVFLYPTLARGLLGHWIGVRRTHGGKPPAEEFIPPSLNGFTVFALPNDLIAQ